MGRREFQLGHYVRRMVGLTGSTTLWSCTAACPATPSPTRFITLFLALASTRTFSNRIVSHKSFDIVRGRLSGSRPSYIFKALSRLPCSAFFTHRAWMMWKKKWIIPACIVPMFVASAGCAMGVAITFNSQPMPVIGQKLLWTMVCPLPVLGDCPS